MGEGTLRYRAKSLEERPADLQNYNHFTGVDYDAASETKAIFKVSQTTNSLSSFTERAQTKTGLMCRFKEMARSGHRT